MDSLVASGVGCATAPPIAKEEADATIAALKPPKRQRPLIAIVGINDATETTDYLMPYGILRRADVADVVALATEPGPMTLYPALKVEPQATVADFDAQHPEGADYVIVPAMSRDDDPAVLQWIKSQAAKGAIVIGVCAGAKIVGNAGLLDGKRATTHWYYLKELRDKHPAIHYVADRRLVVDQGVATTTGITASMPMSLTLIEAIAGRDKAQAVGRDLGLMRLGRASRQRCVQVHAPVRVDGDRQHARLLEPRAARHRTCARRRRSVARPRRGRLVADLSVTRGDVRRHCRCAADPQRHPHSPRSGRHELARGAAASGDWGSATGQEHWTKPFTKSRPATECAPPTSSPCSSNTRGNRHRSEDAAPWLAQRAGASPIIGFNAAMASIWISDGASCCAMSSSMSTS